MKTVVVGTGYVGAVQAACLTHLGHTVVGVDLDKEKIKALENGRAPFFEPGLNALLKEGIDSGRLLFTVSLSSAMELNPDAVFVCVQTPGRKDGRCDLRFVEQVLKELGDCITADTVAVIKSTVPPGTRGDMRVWLGNDSVELASNPEFLREGSSVKDFLDPDRVIMGVEGERGARVLRELYKDIDAPVLVMNFESAQLAKYTSNAMLASRLSFMNEIANMADAVGADIKDIEKAVGLDSRIGSRFLRAGAGFGGSCFPKDVLALHYAGEDRGYSSKLIAPIIEVNNKQPLRFVQKIHDRLGDMEGMPIAVWGLAFNKGTDDVRESPAIRIVKALAEVGAKVRAYDPKAMDNARVELGKGVQFVESKRDALTEAQALLVLTEWPEFERADWKSVKETLKQPLVFDGKNFLAHGELAKAGFEVYGMGLRYKQE